MTCSFAPPQSPPGKEGIGATLTMASCSSKSQTPVLELSDSTHLGVIAGQTVPPEKTNHLIELGNANLMPFAQAQDLSITVIVVVLWARFHARPFEWLLHSCQEHTVLTSHRSVPLP